MANNIDTAELTSINLHNTTLNDLTEVTTNINDLTELSTILPSVTLPGHSVKLTELSTILPSETLTGHSVKLNTCHNLSNKNPLLYNSPAREKDSVIVLHHVFATSTPKNMK